MLFPPTLSLVPTVAVIPVKSFALGKGRLSGMLTPEQRALLAKAMAAHVSASAEQAGWTPVVVTADESVAEWATRRGIPSITDPGDGLSAAASVGAEWASQSGSRWVILHSDLPLLTSTDLHRFWQAGENGDAIAPSADGGTSAITATAEIDFTYGPASFSRHLARLDDATIISLPGLLHDVDSPDDLDSVLDHPRGRWIEDVIGQPAR